MKRGEPGCGACAEEPGSARERGQVPGEGVVAGFIRLVEAFAKLEREDEAQGERQEDPGPSGSL